MITCAPLSSHRLLRAVIHIRSEFHVASVEKAGYFVVDQVRTVDRERLLRRLGRLAPATLGRTLSVLQEMFAP